MLLGKTQTKTKYMIYAPSPTGMDKCACSIIGPRREKTCLQGFRQSEIQTSLLSYKDYLENLNFTRSKFTLKQITKALIRLRGCAGWLAHVLFANPRRQGFSRRDPSKEYLNAYAIGEMRWLEADAASVVVLTGV